MAMGSTIPCQAHTCMSAAAVAGQAPPHDTSQVPPRGKAHANTPPAARQLPTHMSSQPVLLPFFFFSQPVLLRDVSNVHAAATLQQKRLWRAFACGFALLTFGVGFLGGFFTAKHMGTHYLTLCSSSTAHDVNEAPGTALQPTTGFSRGMPTNGLALREMDPPWSEEAMRLRSRPGASGKQPQGGDQA